MNKNKLGLLVLSIISLTACTIGQTKAFSWDSYKNNSLAMSAESAKFKNYKLADYSKLQERMDIVENEVKVNKNRNKFVQNMNLLGNDLYNMVNSYIIASTKYYKDADQSYKTKADTYYDKYVEIYDFILGIEEDIFHSSPEIKKAYFGDMSDKDIEKKISGNAEEAIITQYTGELLNLQDEGSELYLKFSTDFDKKSYLHDGTALFMRYIEKANELVSKIDYENYLDFSYSYDYSRDYKIGDVEPFIRYVKEYFVPIYLEKPAISEPEGLNRQLLTKFQSYNFCNRSTDAADYLSSYAEELGGEYLKCYNKAFRDGYYCFSDSAKSMQTAYQWGLTGLNDSVLYFSKNYQDALSVIHEFGHYYSCTADFGIRNGDAMDLQETYSQGNEYTFLTYLIEQTKNSDDAATYQYILDSKIYGEINYLIQEAVITEIEKFAYTAENLTQTELTTEIQNILSSYSGTASDTYYMGALVSSPCYYISYATSLLEACQFATKSFSDAKNSYKKLVEDNKPETMVERWTNAGLTSPFEESTFKTLAALFKGIADKY